MEWKSCTKLILETMRISKSCQSTHDLIAMSGHATSKEKSVPWSAGCVLVVDAVNEVPLLCRDLLHA
jgi:hypothetical protein